ncbi:ester cyclase [Arenibaculum sp.]|jgi:steroid delta-isomerase-like uncharacterized protein|uniref:ester cyclase n=1 Tax=Arenibaculum sp. TaxID=2865862 RepID=UPI002E0FEB6D|nr:ester cyclase [Arenibaculum sp.]
MDTAALHENTDLVRRFIEQVWQQGRVERITDFVTAGFVENAYEPRTREGHAATVRTLLAAVPDAAWTIERTTAQDDRVVCELRVRGTHLGPFRAIPASGNRIDARQYRTFRIEGGLIAEHWALFDTAAFLRQIEAAPHTAEARAGAAERANE